MANEIKKIPKYLAMLGAVVAIGAPILAWLAAVLKIGMWDLSGAVWLIAAAGAVAGLTIPQKQITNFFIAALVVGTIGLVLANIPMVGTVLQQIFGNISALALSVAAMPALRAVLYKVGIDI